MTGACGGIGAAVVRGLVEQGARVAALDVDGSAVRELAAAYREKGHAVDGYAVDVADRAAVETAVAEIEESGTIALAVNIAGILCPGPVLELAAEDWAAVFAVNSSGVFNVSTAVARHMTPRRAGAIVTVSSDAARLSRTGMAAYAASKSAATRFTLCLGLELAPFGIRCNVVSPGTTATAMRRQLWGGDAPEESAVAGSPESFRGGIPLGRIADPEDVADAVLFLASPRAQHITMHDLRVDGGAGLGS
ncbi:2,3-dihydro-2,3-dihydroxybenzoate dehydrogenase [Nocardiopsis ansamitocini]|uniref:2,3-dihydro-2,3-dihydroxybenzoate dehydrogenase n=1 Tax=Nocardiopsis ansamitocini TaxID=1670832 RepID=A0A9W6UL17_9ACTN|nr:2,3-dihydro-2,3-dihydroxybenzoate dehydrogenase [Nocardiopsis ansamitocini]